MGAWFAFTAKGNRSSGTFHYCPDWIGTGKRACDGRTMTYAGWTTDEHTPAPHLRVCKHCLKMSGQTQKTSKEVRGLK